MIRPYKPIDKEALLEIFKCNTPKYFDIKEISDFEDYLEHNSDTYLSIELNNTIVGGTGYFVNEDDHSGRITWIFFHPNYAGMGLGKQSVQYCLDILSKDNRVEKYMITTSQFAYQFFEKFGFVITKMEKEYWGPGLDLYEMEMPI